MEPKDNEQNTETKKSKFDTLIELKDPEILENWRKEQDELKKKLITTDFYKFNFDNNEQKEGYTELKYIGGVDISASKKYPTMAVSALVICDKDLKIVYQDYELVEMTEPYIPGFLAFRETKHLVNLINKLKQKSPEFIPQVILVDGNGIFHVKGFGLASHLGVLVDIPTIGCSKTIFSVDGINKKKVKDIAKKYLLKGGDFYPLIGDSKTQLGYALKSNDESTNPMCISIGHKVSNETALKIVQMTTLHRVPQPIRLSDKISRRLIAEYENFIGKNPGKEWNLDEYLKEHYDTLHENLDD